MNSALNAYTVEELVEMADICNSSFAGQVATVIQIFEKFEQPPSDTLDHFDAPILPTGLNKTGDVRILDIIPGSRHEHSYMNILQIKNL